MKGIKVKTRKNTQKRNLKSNSNNVLSNAETSDKFTVLPSPIKSDNDKKKYKVIQLTNGLRACLVCDFPCIKECKIPNKIPSQSTDASPEASGVVSQSDSSEYETESEEDESSCDEDMMESEDPGTDDAKLTKKPKDTAPKMAAAALTVGVGSFSDPKDIQGMAHFVEHMVFMGSEKFPQENDFDSFIKKAGGSNNASTDCETTTFYFECLEKDLLKALDKFSQFFIAPLMKRGSMTREREAIESEFQMALPSDVYRKEQLLCSFADECSPVNSFSWGNLITLRDSVRDDDLYARAHKFRKLHYSAHRMTLAIQARLPLTVLERYVLQCFSNVPHNSEPGIDFKVYTEEVFNTPEFHKLYYVQSTKDQYQVDLTWASPSLLDKYRSKPHQYISWLLGDEGKGSLISYLKKKVWALDIYTGNEESGMEHNAMYAFFTVSIILTKEGLNHLDEVIEAVFSYLQLLKKVGPQERVFKEIKLIEDTSFKFATEHPAVDLVEELSESMQHYPPEHYITGPELYFEYDPEGIKKMLCHLLPEKMNILVLSKEPPEGKSYTKTEKWFSTEYMDTDIPNEWITKWQKVKPYSEFKLPPPNPFLTVNFDLLPPVKDNPAYPKKLVGTPLMELWYRKDDTFKLPIAYYYIYLISPYALESAVKHCMIDILVVLLNLNLVENVYPAQLAGLNHSIYCADKGIVIRVSGYNEKLPILIEKIQAELTALKSNLKEDMFEAVKEKMIKFYRNKLLKPSVLATEVRLKLLLKTYWSHLDKSDAVCGVTYKMIEDFLTDYFKNLYIKALVQGNVAEDTARNTIQKFAKNLKSKPLDEEIFPRFQIMQISKGEFCCRVTSFNKKDTNSIITNYYQTGSTTIDRLIKTELIQLLIEEPMFNILRTKEQLGYNVYFTLRDTFGVTGHSLTVNAQATKHTSEYVESRIEEFIKHATKLLGKLHNTKFTKMRNSLIKTKKLADVHLEEEVTRNWGEITSDDYMFDRLKQEIKALETVTLKHIKEMWKEHHTLNNGMKKISVQVVGYDTAKEDEELEKKETADLESCSIKNLTFLGDEKLAKAEKKPLNYFVTDFEKFKESLHIHPLKTLKRN